MEMYFAGNFDNEKGQLSRIDETISIELAAMEQTISGMSAYWQDEKSAEFISGANELIAQIKTKKNEAITSGNELLNQVAQALRIYE